MSIVLTARSLQGLIMMLGFTGGADTNVQLCPGSMHRLQSPIFFTASGQVLTTEGDPTDRMRAMILVEGETQSVAVQ